MSLLFRVVFANECTSTHHKLALDALLLLKNEHGEAWRNLFLKHFDQYLDGAKAPDKKFRDFRNHVLHVRDGEWGGAIGRTRHWYDQTVELLRNKKWSKAIYAAGVCSHYFTDPVHPFHTGQSEEEGVVHRAVEWSVTKSYDQLRQLLEEELGGFPTVRAHRDATWLEEMVREGAQLSNEYYEIVIDHYNLDVGRRNPPAGFDRTLREIFARLIGHSAAAWAVILDRAFEESGVEPPVSNVTVLGYLATMTVPVARLNRRLTDRADRKAVERIYREYKRTGKVVRNLSRDDAQVRALHAEEVLQIPLEELNAIAIGPIGRRHVPAPVAASPPPPPKESANESAVVSAPDTSPVASRARVISASISASEPAVTTPPQQERESEAASPAAQSVEASSSSLRFYLELSDDIVDAPSIGSKTAKIFRKRGGVRTVGQFLEASADELAVKLRLSYADAETIRAWQAQARLACEVPNLRGHDAQILVSCDFARPSDLAELSCDDVLPIVQEFARTSDGKRILRSGKEPDREEVENWIEWANCARQLDAA